MNLQDVLLLFSIMGGIVSLIIGIVSHLRLAMLIAAASLMLVGAIVIIGYFGDAPQVYTFPSNKTSMALPTGICFLISGFCHLMTVLNTHFKPKNK